MRKVYIDSRLHYGLQKRQDGLISVLEFGTGDPEDEAYDSCPRLEHRGPFELHEGRVIETFSEGEKVEFILGSFKAKISASQADGLVRCGDDLSYHLTEKKSENA